MGLPALLMGGGGGGSSRSRRTEPDATPEKGLEKPSGFTSHGINRGGDNDQRSNEAQNDRGGPGRNSHNF